MIKPVLARQFQRQRRTGQLSCGVFAQRRPFKTIGIFFGNKSGRQICRLPARMVDQRRQKRDIVADALQHKPVQCRGHGPVCPLSGGGMAAQFGNHRIVKHRDLVTLDDAGIDPYRGTILQCFCRRLKAHKPADGGH